ncbi:hypothetical protein CONPUDRAFT_67654 [Coniophora puteana RWD-64-598 SS2]|uniref:Endonuclease/exonuclease/phosphatase domain-containing protein n=1 Tax=Coniophora puteana (strain RWD-64-598) TaxID=741705 RepID=R7SGY2_CONPW|nr:uncharacterized protein CONPUDRAFT_67654 [Coniophora puteana RWD-64-598 SS2]EIW74309.1 hypothetical protein CONPUDRAFT_67654 [Coniophora puteana RWD-64-598 SS2]
MNRHPLGTTIRILQINMHKSHDAHLDLLNNNLRKNWDVIVLQEPCLNKLGLTRASSHWQVAYPTPPTGS